MARVDKLAKLVAVFDQFHEAIVLLEAPLAMQLAGNWARSRGRYAGPEAAPRAALASGMEQGLREMPMVLESLPPQTRKSAAEALAAAITAHYPEFLDKEEARLEKIKARGSIRTENEYYFIRYHIDVLEGGSDRKAELIQCYELIDRFEARGK